MAGRIESIDLSEPAIRTAEILRNREAVQTSQIDQNNFDNIAAQRAAVRPLAPEGPEAPLALEVDQFRSNPARNLNPAEVSPDEARARFGIGQNVNVTDFAAESRDRVEELLVTEDRDRLEAIADRGDDFRADQEGAVRRQDVAAPDLTADLVRRDQILTEASAEAQAQRSEDLAALAGLAQQSPARSPLLDVVPPPEARPLVVEASDASAASSPLLRGQGAGLPPRRENPVELAVREPEASRNFGVGGLVNVAA